MKNKLAKYQARRNFNKTTEPRGKIKKSFSKLRFCVQHHLARKDHYDFRLEFNGTLLSWAVPKGPSYNPTDKRLAIQVEDHPLAYRTFEGTIPKGEYGGGTVQLWDQGYWQPLDDNIASAIKKGVLKFTLHGKRLRGKWSIFKTKEKNWILIKEKDNIKLYDDINYFKTSIKTGRTVEEIANNKPKNLKNKEPIIIEGVTITSPDKVIFKRPRITKLDIVLYYQSIQDKILPFLEKRLISVIRAPEGSEGPTFFKKHLENTNSGIGHKTIKNSSGHREDYYYIKDIKGLISEVQMNSFEFHIWGSKVDKINSPNLMIFDLDPDEHMSINKVREGVKDLKQILDDLKLEAYLKTSGGKGYHVMVPINNTNWQEFRAIAKNIAELMASKWPHKYTSNMRKDKRKNKIFIDWIRNTKGATSVASYSLRLRNKAPISMPITWEELDTIKPNEITIKDILS